MTVRRALPLSGILLGLGVLAFQHQAHAQTAVLAGMLGSKALLVVDGGNPKAVAAGDSYQGVKVISMQGDSAVLEIKGQRHTARVGGSPVSVGTPVEPGTGARIVLSASSDGHFVTQGMINSRPVQFLIDTGATTLGISVSDAERIGLVYKQGQPVQVATANGVVRGWKVQLASVRLDDVEVRDLEAVVTPLAMPYVLLGNSFLARFQMTRSNQQMVLEKRP